MLLASFDIGEKNFAYCIADHKTGNDLAANEEEQLIILKVAHHNVILKKTQTVIESCMRISALMSEDEQLMECDRFIIEQQMRCNTRAQRIAQHVWSTLYARFPDRTIKFVPSHMKTQHFIGKNKLKDKERKTWSVMKVMQEGVMGDCERHRQIIEEIEGMKKKDDVCDTILQAIAYIGREMSSASNGSAPTKSDRRSPGGGAAKVQRSKTKRPQAVSEM